MRIFSKKSFQFKDPNGQEPHVTVQAQAFTDVPDWVENSLMFQWALYDADIQIMNSAEDVAKVEKEQTDAGLKVLRAKAKELGVKGHTKMGAEELLSAIEEAAAAKASVDQQNKTGDPLTGQTGDPPAGGNNEDNNTNTGA